MKKENNNLKKFIILAIIVFIVLVFFYYQNNHLMISNYEITNEKTTDSFESWRIVQISDLHNKTFGKNNKKLIEKVKALNPDIIVITGDVVDSSRTKIEVATKLADGLVDIAPTYYITGNHENWLSDEEQIELYNGLELSGVHILCNEFVSIDFKNSHINLIGLFDKNLIDDTIKTLKINEEEFNILLAHEPQHLDSYARSNIDLVLSGHAHGGQFILPFIGGVFAPDQGFNPKYTEGMYEEKNTRMIVSRGLGNSVIPVRLFNYPEIVCVDIKRN